LKPVSLPFRVLTTLLYGAQSWLSRHPGGTVIVPVTALATALRTRADKVALAVFFLEEAGLIEQLKYQGSWFEARLKAPVGAEWPLKVAAPVVHLD
jgi:hypothetical protein